MHASAISVPVPQDNIQEMESKNGPVEQDDQTVKEMQKYRRRITITKNTDDKQLCATKSLPQAQLSSSPCLSSLISIL